MKKIEISKKTIKKIEKRLLKVLEKHYPILKEVSSTDKFVIIAHASYNRPESEEEPYYLIEVAYGFGKNFDETVELIIGDGNLDFIAGQFYQAITNKTEDEETGDE